MRDASQVFLVFSGSEVHLECFPVPFGFPVYFVVPLHFAVLVSGEMPLKRPLPETGPKG